MDRGWVRQRKKWPTILQHSVGTIWYL